MVIRILWDRVRVHGRIALTNAGTISNMSSPVVGFSSKGSTFSFPESNDEKILILDVTNAQVSPGPCKTIIHVYTEDQPFSFYLADVCNTTPIFIPCYHVAVTTESDARRYGEIAQAIWGRGLRNTLQEIEAGAEATFEDAAASTRNMNCETWLGLSRDVRIFEIGLHTNAMPDEPWDFIMPKDHCIPVDLDEHGVKRLRYDYFAGRGVGCRNELRRWLESGVLPILNVENLDGGIQYLTKMFVSYESRPLTEATLTGTNYLVSDFSSAYSAMTASQKEEAEKIRLRQQIEDAEDETVLYMRIECINLHKTPRYCWIRIPQPNVSSIPERDTLQHYYNRDQGFGSFCENSYYITATLNGKPVPLVEMAVLLPPNGKCTYEFKLPHRPISRGRIEQLAKVDLDLKYAECKQFWESKLSHAAQLRLPDQRVENMMRAGLLHLDLVCFGKEGEDAVAPTVGVYAPIGTESSPIIHFLEFMGQEDLARRSIMYFMNKQHDNGFIHNFESYMSETGFALYNAAEHYRYSKDIEWLKAVSSNLVKGCDYLINWCEENKIEELRGKGYGMIAGKIADPADPFHGYMLNASVYAALKSCGEVLGEINDKNAARLRSYADELKGYIDESLCESFAVAPVAPLSDGTWSIAAGPWPESIGSVCLYAKDNLSFSHASSNARDTMTGIGYMQYFNMLETGGVQDNFIVNTNTDVFFSDNTGYSQPYYNTQPYAHLKRGEVKAFLKEFYFGMASLADRETYTFWEHHYHVSPHKTHEEAWFLMRCRWMLALEDGDTLSLLPGVPRRWLENGEAIEYANIRTRLGTVGLSMQSYLEAGFVKVCLELADTAASLPREVRVRVPHPQGLHAKQVSRGRYDSDGETVVLENFTGRVELQVYF